MKLFISVMLLAYTLFGYGQNSSIALDTVNKKPIELKEVIVTGDITRDPAQVRVKSDYQSKSVQPKNSGELFQDINGFYLIKRGNYAIDPSFRGLQYEQLNIQYDGGTKAFHACPNRMDPATTLVNPEEVSRIEIIKGPFSVRYGTNFGGVINMVTTSGASIQDKISGSVSSGFESNGNSTVNMVSLQSRMNKFYVTGNISHREYGNYQDGNQNEIPSAFRSLGYGLKLGYDIQNNQNIQLGLRQNFGRDVLHAGLPMDTDVDNSTIATLDYSLKSNLNYFKGLQAKAYYSYVDHIMSNLRRPSAAMTEAVAPVEATTYGGRLETDWKLGKKWRLFYGIDAVNISRDGGRNRLVKVNMMGNPLPTPLSFYDKIWQDSYLNTYGNFAEAKYILSPKSTITLGSRVDWVISEIRDADETFANLYPNLNRRNETNVSGHVSFKQFLADNHSIEISLGRGVRSANMEERFIAFFNIGRDPYEYVGNPNLKAEVNNQLEVSYQGKTFFEKGMMNQLQYGASVYYSKFENYIMGVVDETLIRKFNPTTPPIHPKVFRNIDNAFRTGFEVYGNMQFLNHFHFQTEVSYVYTENKDFNESLPLTPPLMTRLKLSYEIEKFWASVQYNITARQNKISRSFDENPTPGYEIMDIKAGFVPMKNMNLGLGILNVFDQFYYHHLTFAFNNQPDFGRTPITEPGRNFTVFVNYKF